MRFFTACISLYLGVMVFAAPAFAEHYRVTINWKKINEREAQPGGEKGFSLVIPGGWVVGEVKLDADKGMGIQHVSEDDAEDITCRVKTIAIKEDGLEFTTVQGWDIVSFDFWTTGPLVLPQFFRDPTDGMWSIQQVRD